jgi:hypothetical protein
LNRFKEKNNKKDKKENKPKDSKDKNKKNNKKNKKYINNQKKCLKKTQTMELNLKE